MKRILTGFTLFALAILISGCGATKQPKIILKPVDDLTNQTVVLKSMIPFAENAMIKHAIKTDCSIQSQLSTFTQQFSKNEKVNVVFDDNANETNTQDYYLDLVIIGAISQGNPFIGHFKQTKVRGILYKNSQNIASFSAMRTSNGGFGAGFKGSCSVLGRTVEALGKDISKWLAKPTNGDYLGD